ncbi:MAG: carbohydrate binding family 9 domain-containing protein [Nitrospirota bacterium]
MVQTAKPPVIDGHLVEAVWARAAVVPELTQAYPNEGAPPSTRTEVRLLFDADFLYIGVRAFDHEPERIIAKERQRDIEMDGDDYVAVALDPFHDLRRGYYFQVNPLGNRRDGLISPHTDLQNGGLQIQFEWDGIWYADAMIDAQGWTAELAIPMKTISFDPNQTTWGFNVERVIPRKNETMRWTAATRTK